IFGAGHVAQAVSNIAKTLRFNIALYDFREDILNEFPGSQYDRKSLLDFSKLSVMDKEEIILDDKDFVLIMTHNHIHDIEVLKFIYRNYPQMNYIGMIGSRRKVYEAVTIIKEHFGSSINLKNLYAPVGINIGGDLPEEIALSIMAEIQSNVYNRNQHHLRLDELNE
ncbi:MAG: XdhC family protein, partial [Bacillota bacterium]